jgi:hypothetical protein
MTELTSTERRSIMLADMEAAAARFYAAAARIGNHPFVEFAGLMNEYIKICRHAHEAGIDFTQCNGHSGNHLPMVAFEIDYINEKLECIFTGRSIVNQEAARAVVGSSLAEKALG